MKSKCGKCEFKTNCLDEYKHYVCEDHCKHFNNEEICNKCDNGNKCLYEWKGYSGYGIKKS